MQQPQRSEDDDGDTYNRWKTINNGSPILTGQSEVGVGPGPERAPVGSKPWIARHIGRVGSTAEAAPQPVTPRPQSTTKVHSCGVHLPEASDRCSGESLGRSWRCGAAALRRRRPGPR